MTEFLVNVYIVYAAAVDINRLDIPSQWLGLEGGRVDSTSQDHLRHVVI